MSSGLAFKRATRGARLLDRVLPGWFIELDVEKLNLGNGCNCVLGQLATEIVPRKTWLRRWQRSGVLPYYTAACDQLKLNGNQYATYGFNSDSKVEIHELNEAWTAIVRRRLRTRSLA